MAELYSQYASGLQLTAGAIVGNATGVSGLNPIVDRLNSISTADNLITGSMISGTNTFIHFSGGTATGDLSGTSLVVHASGNSSFYKTSYVSIPGLAFKPTDPTNTENYNYGSGYNSNAIAIFGGGVGQSFKASIQIPHAGSIVSMIVDGNDATTTWQLRREGIDGVGAMTIATEAVGTEDTSIYAPIVDNINSCYTVGLLNAASGTIVFGARIGYVTQ